ncbi:MAG: hypothetical protein ACFHVJ_16420 [Aestuariibacter sp.]
MKDSANQGKNWVGLGIGIFLGGIIAFMVNQTLSNSYLDNLINMLFMFFGGFAGIKYIKISK